MILKSQLSSQACQSLFLLCHIWNRFKEFAFNKVQVENPLSKIPGTTKVFNFGFWNICAHITRYHNNPIMGRGPMLKHEIHLFHIYLYTHNQNVILYNIFLRILCVKQKLWLCSDSTHNIRLGMEFSTCGVSYQCSKSLILEHSRFTD